MNPPAPAPRKSALSWLAKYAKGVAATLGGLLTILTAFYAGHSPHWLTWVIGLATALGVVAIPNKAEPVDQLVGRVVRDELAKAK